MIPKSGNRFSEKIMLQQRSLLDPRRHQQDQDLRDLLKRAQHIAGLTVDLPHAQVLP